MTLDSQVKEFVAAEVQRQLQEYGSVFVAPQAGTAPAAPAAPALTVFNIAEFPFFAVPGEATNVAKFNAACQAAKLVHGRVYVPNGHWNPSGGSCVIPVQVDIEGESLAGTIWDGQIYPLNAPLWVNEDPGIGLSFSRYANMTLRGGTWSVKTTTTGTPQNLTFENFQMQMATVAAFGGNNAWESCQFHNLLVDQCANVSRFDQGAINNLEFFAVHFSSISRTILDWPAPCTVEGVDWYGGHWENGGTPGQSTMNVNAVNSMNFFGLYVEGTSSVLITETNSNQGITFYGGHRTAAANGLGGFQPYTYNMHKADGSKAAAQFIGGNSSSFQDDGPDRLFASGISTPAGLFGNNNAVYTVMTKQRQEFCSPRISYPVSAQQDLVVISRAGFDGAITNSQISTLELIFNYYHIDGGGFDVSFSERWFIKLQANGAGAILATLKLADSNDVPRGSTCTVRQKAGATSNTSTIEAVWTGVPAGLQVSECQWSVRALSTSTNADKYLLADLPPAL